MRHSVTCRVEPLGGVIRYATVLLASPLARWLRARPRRVCVNLALWAGALLFLSAGFIPGLLIPILDGVALVHGYHVDRRLDRMVDLVRLRHRRW